MLSQSDQLKSEGLENTNNLVEDKICLIEFKNDLEKAINDTETLDENLQMAELVNRISKEQISFSSDICLESLNFDFENNRNSTKINIEVQNTSKVLSTREE